MSVKRIQIRFILIGLLGIFSSLFSQSQQLINYQGRLILAGSAADTTLSITFTIYDNQSGGNVLWTEPRTVVVTNGIFNILLGSNVPFPKSLFSGNGDRFLALKLGNEPELTTRFRITSVAYAIKSTYADTALFSPSGGDGHSLDAVDGSSQDVVFVAENGNVGIGTTNPDLGSKLNVAGSARASAFRAFESTTGAYAFIESGVDDDGIVQIGGFNDLTENFTKTLIDGDTLVLQTRSGSKVGIGTTSPNEKLSVAGVVESISGGFKFPDGSTQVTAADTGDGGDITTVTAGDGLSGGGTQGDVSLAIGAGTGINTLAESVELDTIFIDGRYVNEGQDGSISSTMISANAVGNSELAADAVTSSEILDETITADDIAADAIGGSELAKEAVTNENIDDRTITRLKIANNALTSDEIGPDAIRNSELDSNAVTSSKILDDTITDSDINANAAIAGTKINPNFGSQNIVTTGTIESTNGGFKFPDGTTQTSAAGTSGGGDITSVTAGQGLSGGRIEGDVSLTVGAGTGITTLAESVELDTLFTDGRYVNEGQESSISSTMISANAVGNSELAADAVTSSEILDETITADDIAADAIGGSELAREAVTNENIDDRTITRLKIANNALTSDEIGPDAIRNSELDSNAVTSSKILDDTITDSDINANAAVAGSKINPNFGSQNVVTSGTIESTNGGFKFPDGTTQNTADVSAGLDTIFTDGRYVNEGQENSISSTMISANAVGNSELATDAVTSLEILDGTITAGDIKDDEVGAAELAKNAVTDENISNRTITRVKIADNALTSDEIGPNAIRNSELDSNAVTSSKILDGTITDSDINANAGITGTKINPNFGSQNIVTTGTIESTNGGFKFPDGTTQTSAAGTSGGGDITTVTAGQGLSGGGIEGDVSLTVGAGTGINTLAESVELDTIFIDGRYVNEAQESSIFSSMIVNGTIGSSDIADDSINSDDIADGSIGSIDVADGSIGSADLSDSAVNSPKIQDGTIQDIDVNSNAQIAGAKINPDFGSQNVITNGNVGIGTTLPAAKLHIAGTPGVDGIMFPDSTIQTTAASESPVDGHSLDAVDDGPVDAVFVDNDGNVGIGTTNPLTPLHIVSSTPGARNYLTLTADDGGNLLITGKGPSDNAFFNLYDGMNNNAEVSFSTNANSYFNVGNLGIGTNNPLFKLDVLKGQTGDVARIGRNTTQYIKFHFDSQFLGNTIESIGANKPFDIIQSSATEDFRMHLKGAGDFKIIDASRAALMTVTDGGEVYIPNGNVGIGTNDPGASLHVIGPDSDTTTAVLKLSSPGQNMLLDGNEIDALDTALNLNLNSGNDVIITSEFGNVGIGTESPSEKLTVKGKIESTSGGFKFPDGTTQITAASGGDGHSLDAADGDPVDVVFVDDNGNVLVGDQSVDYKTFLVAAGIAPPVGSSGAMSFEPYTVPGVGQLAGYLFHFKTASAIGAGTTRADVAVDGRVGIGTTTPNNELHIFSATRDPKIRTERFNGAIVDLVANTNGAAVGTANKQPFHLKVNATNKVSIDTSGNVGIGTESPSEKLTVVGKIESTSGGFKFPDGTTQITASGSTVDGHSLDAADGDPVDVVFVDDNGNVLVGDQSVDYKTFLVAAGIAPPVGSSGAMSFEPYTVPGVGQLAGYLFHFKTASAIGAGTTRADVAVDGRVGIGTTTPNNELHIFSSTRDPKIRTERFNGAIVDLVANTNGAAVGTANKQPFHLKVNATNKVSIDTSGNVGIGMESPSEKLTVVGKIESTSGGFKFPDGTTQITAASGSTVDGHSLDAADGDPVDAVFVNDDGNVGIGTTNPLFKLDVLKGQTGDVTRIGRNTTQYIRFHFDNQFLGNAIESSGADKLFDIIQSGATQDLRMHLKGTGDFKIIDASRAALMTVTDGGEVYIPNGNVGIGTNDPGASLHVIGPDNDTTTAVLKLSSPGQNMLLDGNEIDALDTALNLNLNSGNDVIITSGFGNVGIGTESPSEKLTVKGKVESTSGGFKFPDGTTQTTAAANSGGDITSVTAGQGLSGGGTSGDVSLAVGAGTGISSSADQVELDTVFTDSRYVEPGEANSVSSAMIQDGAINSIDIANSAITSDEIDDNTIEERDIATGAVHSTEIADSTIKGIDITESAIGSLNIADGAVTTDKISSASASSGDAPCLQW